MAAFIELNYEPHYEHFRKYFENGTITTAFFDEPTFWPWGTDYGAPGARLWTPVYHEKYAEMYDGASPVLYYPSLWYDVGEETTQGRNQLQDVRTQMFAENYIGQINTWCQEHGIRLTGHMLLEEWVNPVGLHGDLMRVFQYQDIPGVDVIGAYGYTQEAYKIISSCAYNWDKGWVMSESYGAMGANMDPKVLYKSAMDQYAKRINLMIPHAVWYDDTPETVDYPPELSYQNSRYASELAAYNNYMARLNTLLQEGRHVADIAMLYPIDYLEASFLFNGTPNNPEDADYMQVRETLSLSLRQDFTYLHPSVLDARCTVSGDTLSLNNQVNYENYKVLILPGTKVISLSNLEKIQAFYEGGGKVIATTTLPTQVTRLEDNEAVRSIMETLFGPDYDTASGELERHNAAGGAAFFLASDFQSKLGGVLDQILEQYDVEISDVGSLSYGNFSYIHKVKDGVNYYFFANPSDTSIEPVISIRGELKDPQIWEPATRERYTVSYTVENGVTTLQLPLAPVQSLFVVDAALLPGELNQNGVLSVTDVVFLRKAVLENLNATDVPMSDLNGDNTLTVTDVVLLRKEILNHN